MIPLDDEILMRRVDGELDPAEAARVDSVAAVNSAVSARLQALRGTRAAARDAYPISPDVRDLDLARLIAAAPAQASPLTGIGQALAEAFAPRRALIWGAMATAAFVGGLALGPLLGGRSDGLRINRDGAVLDAGLVRMLDTGLTAEGADTRGRAIGLTFRDSEGDWCRTFTAREAAVAGLACREAEEWRLQVLAPLTSARGEVRTAGTETPEVILTAIDAKISGEALDATAEAAARDGGWQQPN